MPATKTMSARDAMTHFLREEGHRYAYSADQLAEKFKTSRVNVLGLIRALEISGWVIIRQKKGRTVFYQAIAQKP